ncbi:putative plastid-lipid-associated protein 12 [Monoraphidium neglectum]|uniref:Putative plastid-lipid-associated protein 12 n=1 Tax=Monoraphidium neglectum TaxID=145388 RepID=A0A0D2MM87_9CHLO|nr:putative plastid-lipid-associated protein 12 [Monoraphidium neglectum]KIY95935.1 putative plastid-lipid-associated protein 12 [Monoraphidium neglectum]|eukprot:XP_013894955.1 putative plastid-lipid-associated protein 12 [Monoraphidium neglectum]
MRERVTCRVLAGTTRTKAGSRATTELAVLDALRSAKGRGKEGLSEEALQQLSLAISVLEQDGGVADPTTLDAIDGKWRLLYTSRPGSASPIQRTFTGVEAFKIYQEVDLSSDLPRVNNVVDFGEEIGYLIVQAKASTESRPLEGFTPRVGEGLPFGILGKSFNTPPARPNSRIDFQFDQAAFHFKFLPFSIPYPVPFRILGDERKARPPSPGWIDTTYMNQDGTFRLARGNKGTLFVLVKAPQEGVSLESQLLSAIEAKEDELVLSLVGLIQSENPTPQPAQSDRVGGTWRLVWSQQAENASPLQKWWVAPGEGGRCGGASLRHGGGSQQARSLQIIDASEGTLENVVDLGALQIRAQATCAAEGDARTDVNIGGAFLSVLGGKLRVPLPIKGTGFVDWLYLSDDVRVTRGSKGSLFVHVREPEAEAEVA